MENRAKSIFDSAKMYANAAKCLNSSSVKDTQLLMPSQVVAALTLELYFKSLYYLEKHQDFKVNGRHSHNFHTLYLELDTNTQKDLKSEFKNILQSRNMHNVNTAEAIIKAKIPRGFEENIKSWSNIFVKARYIYDAKGEVKHMMFFPEIESALLKVMQTKVSWAQP